MPTVLVSNNSEVLRHLRAPTFRGLGLSVHVVSSGSQAQAALKTESYDLVLVDAELAEISGYELTSQIKHSAPDTKVVLIMGHRIGAREMRRVTECGCDEVLIAPMGADELYDVVAIVLGLARRGSAHYSIDLSLVQDTGARTVAGRVLNLSVDGARLILDEKVGEGTSLHLSVRPESADPIEIDAQVVWAQSTEDGTIVGAAFSGLSEDERTAVARLTEWEIVEGGERPRVVLKGDITEASNFESLLPAMIGKVDFDLSNVKYMNSLGAREWVKFLREAAIHGYEFHACSVPFVLQASTVQGVLGRGSVASFFAPYVCAGCGYEEDRLLQSAAILASDSNEPPTFTCPECGDSLEMDELPDRYLAFLRGE